MTFNNGEYEITNDGESIEISKAALEKWREHYHRVAKKQSSDEIRRYFIGRATTIIDILKHFEELEI